MADRDPVQPRFSEIFGDPRHSQCGECHRPYPQMRGRASRRSDPAGQRNFGGALRHAKPLSFVVYLVPKGADQQGEAAPDEGLRVDRSQASEFWSSHASRCDDQLFFFRSQLALSTASAISSALAQMASKGRRSEWRSGGSHALPQWAWRAGRIVGGKGSTKLASGVDSRMSL